ncbi:MAG: hypothetical protein ACKO6Q_08915 [Bacteroidota bacterium]
MAIVSLSHNISCQPDTLVLIIGPDRFGSAAIDPFNRYIKEHRYSEHDMYAPDTFRQYAKDVFTERAEIRKIRVGFLLSDWCWLPTDMLPDEQPHKLLSAHWPQKPGHTWISDNTGPAQATAWVRVPDHLLEQLKSLSATLEFKHAHFFKTDHQSKYPYQLEILRIGDMGWFSIWEKDRFLYGQPHVIAVTDDLLCTLSLLVEKFELPVKKLDVRLTGEWELASDELVALRQRFSNLRSRESNWRNSTSEHPSHWFTPLEDIFSCE